jgi:hypothetical protein
VKQAKRPLEKAAASNTDPNAALLDLRNTPTEGLEGSQAQRCLGRHTRTTSLPMSQALLQPRFDTRATMQSIQSSQQHQKAYHDRKGKQLSLLQAGDPIRLRPFGRTKTWRPGVVVEQLDDRSYLVDSGGHRLRQNRIHLRPAPPPPAHRPAPDAAPAQPDDPLEFHETLPPPAPLTPAVDSPTAMVPRMDQPCVSTHPPGQSVVPEDFATHSGRIVVRRNVLLISSCLKCVFQCVCGKLPVVIVFIVLHTCNHH